ncbi:GntR family transcriptional regulator [Gordonia sp. DT219]|uniref:GntR family transcriptional regulator n=1 Tax=Gordonia sp. DT219 TaxID=3416658 RepID=UPI003CED0E3F
MNFPSSRTGAAMTRRIRDLLRTEVLSGAFSDGRLPNEEELRTEFGASRAVVRRALDELQREGIVTRRRGVGTVVAHTQRTISLAETHGVVTPAPTGVWSGVMRTKILEWGNTPAGAILGARFGIEPDEPLLRIDYVALIGDTPLGTACNYLRYPQAERVAPDMFGVDWYRMLAIAGIEVGSSTFLFEASVADIYDAELIGAGVGSAMLISEQVIRDPHGMIFDIAFTRNAAKNVQFLSQWRSAAEPGAVSAEQRDPRL